MIETEESIGLGAHDLRCLGIAAPDVAGDKGGKESENYGHGGKEGADYSFEASHPSARRPIKGKQVDNGPRNQQKRTQQKYLRYCRQFEPGSDHAHSCGPTC